MNLPPAAGGCNDLLPATCLAHWCVFRITEKLDLLPHTSYLNIKMNGSLGRSVLGLCEVVIRHGEILNHLVKILIKGNTHVSTSDQLTG